MERGRGWDIINLDWWYWLVSGYGERSTRAVVWLLVQLASFAFLYTKVGFELRAPATTAPVAAVSAPGQAGLDELPLADFQEGLTYALSAVLSQRPEPKAHSFWAKICVSLEMMLVPLQAALLALAIRRRFMR